MDAIDADKKHLPCTDAWARHLRDHSLAPWTRDGSWSRCVAKVAELSMNRPESGRRMRDAEGNARTPPLFLSSWVPSSKKI